MTVKKITVFLINTNLKSSVSLFLNNNR